MRKRTGLRMIGPLILLVVTMGIMYLFLPYFYYSDMVILGETSLDKERLVAMSKVDYDRNIYRIDIRRAEKNIKEDPIIKKIEITRRFPTTLVFSVLERLPVGAVSFDGGFAIIDEEGYVIKIVQNVTEVKKPIIVGVKAKIVKLGEQIVENPQFSLVLNLIEEAQNAKLMDNISDVNMSETDDVKMTTVNGIQVWLGSGSNLNYKMLMLHQILLDLHSKEIYHGIIDMRYNSYPVYREG